MDIYVLDKDFTTIAVIDRFKSLIWTDRYNGYGDFELYTPLDIVVLSYLAIDNYLWIKESEHIMIIEDIRIQSDVDSGKVMIVTGRSLESLFERRIIWDRFSMSNKTVDEIICQIVIDNVSNPTDQKRKFPNFGVAIQEGTMVPVEKISLQRFGDSVYDAVVEICEVYSLGWKVVMIEGSLVFVLYSGLDRSYSQSDNPWVVFSPKYENLINSDYILDKKELKTITLVAGEGEGSARKTVVVDAYPEEELSGFDRRELFTDARDLSSVGSDGSTVPTAQYNQMLISRGQEKLAEQTITSEFTGQAETTWMFKYGEDFGMGDIVQIANEFGIEEEARVTEFILSVSDSGVEAYPTFSIV